MKNYEIVYSKKAIDDLNNLANYIIYTCKAPKTSSVYAKSIIHSINNLAYVAESIPLYNRKSLSQYGNSVRRINYKKMAIIYTISGNIVIIQRILPGALFTE
jgi:plasmid stabilization system protein ParE